ncbi:hypothetical protein [Prosthecobacter sp.]|uniref:hypothetical protein n=1 Tax=Prosthecobacter sp. TaxID=1965333 RepID=UPI003783FA00
MSNPKPNVNASPATVAVPQTRDIYIEATFGPGAFDKAPTTLTEQDARLDYSSGKPCGGSQATCDHTTGLSFKIRDNTNFWPVMLGFQVVTRTGGVITTTQGTPVQLSTTATTYPWVDTSSGTYTYKQNFKVWRKH